jgi:hypothetical protein
LVTVTAEVGHMLPNEITYGNSFWGVDIESAPAAVVVRKCDKHVLSLSKSIQMLFVIVDHFLIPALMLNYRSLSPTSFEFPRF